jgi:hypothetical protein
MMVITAVKPNNTAWFIPNASNCAVKYTYNEVYKYHTLNK